MIINAIFDILLSNEAQILFAIVGLFSGFAVILYYTYSLLSHENGSDIRLVWYFFSLSLVATFIIASWAIENGFISKNGQFYGSQGTSLKKLLNTMLDINLDLQILYTIVVVIVVPQLFCYILSAILGCASPPRFLKGSFDFLIFGVGKTFSVSSGILISLFIFGWSNSLIESSLKNIFISMFTPIVMISLSFIVFIEFRAAEILTRDFNTRFPHFHKMLLKIHEFATRRINAKAPEESIDDLEIKVSEMSFKVSFHCIKEEGGASPSDGSM